MLNFQQTNVAQLVSVTLSGDGQILGSTIQSGFNEAKRRVNYSSASI